MNQNPAENPPADWEDCDCCGGCHPPGYSGDCRDDRYRWPSKITTAKTASAVILTALRGTSHAINTNELARLIGMRNNPLTNTLLNAMAQRGLVKNIAKPKTLGWWIATEVKRQD